MFSHVFKCLADLKKATGLIASPLISKHLPFEQKELKLLASNITLRKRHATVLVISLNYKTCEF